MFQIDFEKDWMQPSNAAGTRAGGDMGVSRSGTTCLMKGPSLTKDDNGRVIETKQSNRVLGPRERNLSIEIIISDKCHWLDQVNRVARADKRWSGRPFGGINVLGSSVTLL